MSLLHALILGLVQGVTEFLPVSSSGHLAVVPWLFGWNDFGGNNALENAFDVALHLGTLLGATIYLRSDIARYSKAAVTWISSREPLNGDSRIAVFLALTVIPTGLIGAAAVSFTEDLGDRIWLVGGCLILFGFVLWVTDQRKVTREVQELTLGHALVLGAVQGLAFQPGVSRSGVTISAFRFLGISRVEAARLTFLMSLPVIAGAGIVKVFEVEIPSDWWLPFLLGMGAAALSGWLSVRWLIRLVSRTSFQGVTIYRIAIGIIVLVLLASGVR
ncbi:MAG TPA: undecaprenyl-diphosphate phosphatase [Acidimicrobiales bacterium]|nr:undecaprenyl-diphosphate phosphatase [Acidimicrobiales bacterium]